MVQPEKMGASTNSIEFVRDDLFRDDRRLVGLPMSIHGDQLEQFPVDAARGVDLIDRHLGAVHLLEALFRHVAGQGAAHRKTDRPAALFRGYRGVIRRGRGAAGAEDAGAAGWNHRP